MGERRPGSLRLPHRAELLEHPERGGELALRGLPFERQQYLAEQQPRPRLLPRRLELAEAVGRPAQEGSRRLAIAGRSGRTPLEAVSVEREREQFAGGGLLARR